MGIFGISREKVKDIRRKETKETLKRRKRAKSLEERTQRAKSEASYYEAKARRKKAKKSASREWPKLPTVRVKVKKKKQGRKLSRKRPIRLI